MRVGVLGATEAWRGERPLDLGTRKQRALLAGLVLHHGRPVPVDTVVDLLWGEHPPAGATGTLQVYVAGLRRALEPERAARAPARVLVTVAAGYAVRLPEQDVDVARFDQAIQAVHRGTSTPGWLDPPALPVDELERRLGELEAALADWRGSPFLDLGDAPAARVERARLEDLRAVGLEDRATLGLALGRHATVAAELEALTAAYPLRERLWGLRAVALARSGRQADALDALRQVRDVLADELGLEPGQALREVHTAVLRQSPELQWRPPEPAHRGVAPGGGPGHAQARTVGATDAGGSPSQGRDRATGWALGRPDGILARSGATWPFVGRSRELATLTGLLDQATAGTAGFAALVGEPGIGKSRLLGELADLASERDVRVVGGRCSQDEGAPPLWPWQQVLRALGKGLQVGAGQDEGAQFRTWEALVGSVLAVTRSGPLLVLLDDLHWADVSTLRVLRLLAETADAARLLVVVTWRPMPPPVGALADLAESLARRHAVRLDLAGLGPDDVATVVAAVSEATPTAGQTAALAERTEGNPFFLVEYARLARERGDLSVLLAESDPPAGVQDVLVRRLQRLPPQTRDLVRVAAVCGREFDLHTLAGSAETDEDAALDHLDAAVAAGLVREDAAERFVFAHALVRDTAYASIPPTRRARRHARLAAVLDTQPGRASEAARHWLAAGPDHAARAWRAATSAAESATALHAHEQAAALLESALAAMGRDLRATPRDRYDVLMTLAETHRWSGTWGALLQTVESAIVVAEEIGDVRLVAEAASATSVGAMWQSAPYGAAHADIVAALRRSMAGLAPHDDPLLCRVMLSLANELYYGSTFKERSALVEQAIAMADRLGDDALLLDAYQMAFVSLWSPRTLALRLRLATQAVELATRVGNERAMTVGLALLAVAQSEAGQVEAMRQTVAEARRLATRLRLPYGLIVVDGLELTWLAMAGRFDEAERLLATLGQMLARMSVPQTDDALAGALVSLRLWQGRVSEVLPFLAARVDGGLPVTATVVMLMLRAGQTDQARSLAASHPLSVDLDDWMSTLVWGACAESALGLGDKDLAAASYAALTPYAGTVCAAGSGSVMGPVDAFLAQAAAAVGDLRLARRHADDAQRLMAQWHVPLAAAWFREVRQRWSF